MVRIRPSSESELKYAAERALAWMKGALMIPEVAPWIDPAVIEMLSIAVARSLAEPQIPSRSS